MNCSEDELSDFDSCVEGDTERVQTVLSKRGRSFFIVLGSWIINRIVEPDGELDRLVVGLFATQPASHLEHLGQMLQRVVATMWFGMNRHQLIEDWKCFRWIDAVAS